MTVLTIIAVVGLPNPVEGKEVDATVEGSDSIGWGISIPF